MTARIGFGSGAALRPGAASASRYVAPRSLHAGASWIAAASCLFATLMVLAVRVAG